MRNISPSGMVILNPEVVSPFTVALGKSRYPELEEIAGKLADSVGKVITLNATQIAREAGSHLAANIVMLGALFGTGRLPIKRETVTGEIENRFAAKLVPVNLKAFDLGFQKSREDAG